MKPTKIIKAALMFDVLLNLAVSVSPALAQPPIRDPHTPGFVKARELPDGAIPSVLKLHIPQPGNAFKTI